MEIEIFALYPFSFVKIAKYCLLYQIALAIFHNDLFIDSPYINGSFAAR